MPHRLEDEYGLTADEMLDAFDKRFRAKVTLEGAVAEVQMEKQIRALQNAGVIARYEEHDRDGYPDFTIWLPDRAEPILAECKNVRDTTEACRSKGVISGYKVETQKTRTSNEDPSSRFYGVNQFQFIGVCLGKKTKNWAQFMYIRVEHLAIHKRTLANWQRCNEYPYRIRRTSHLVPIPSGIYRQHSGRVIEAQTSLQN